MKTLRSFSLYAGLFLLMVSLAGLASGQTALTQTTLASAVGIGPASLAGGAQANLATTLNLTSATGVNQAFLGTQPVTYLFIDQELLGVLSLVPGQTTIFNVLRAQAGTKAAYHGSGSMVLIGTMTPQFGGFSGSGGFQVVDPPLGGVCNYASTGLTPWVNVLTAAQWICSSVAAAPATNGQWIPGWNNPLNKVSPGFGPVTASASGAQTIPAPFFHLSGTNTMTSFTIPVGMNATAVGYASFCYVADGASVTTATNNIGTAITATANNVYCWFWDPTNSKFYVK